MCHDPQTVARRHLVVTPYEADGENRMVPQIPDTCPLGIKDGRPCRLFLDHWRPRKTGPCFPLTVLHCCTHETAFTLYPPGYTPWGRKKWAPVAPDGAALTSEGSSVLRFHDTYFEATLAAAEGIVWAREKEFAEDFRNPSLITQHCHLERALRLLGLKGDPGCREAFAQTLLIPGQRLHEAAQAMAWPSDLSTLGRTVREVLSEIPRFLGDLFERLAAGGAAVGLWPVLHVWRPSLRQLQRRVFSHEGTAADRAPP